MKIVVLTSGTRGDIQPFVALAVGLQAAGHDVIVATNEQYRRFVEERGLPLAPMSGDPQTALATEEGQRMVAAEANPLTYLPRWAKLVAPFAVDFTRDAVAVCEDCDLIVGTTAIYFACETVAAKTGKPLVFGTLAPIAPSMLAPGMMQPLLPPLLKFLGPCGYYGLAQWVGLQFFAQVFADTNNMVREALGGIPKRSRWFDTSVFRKGPLFLNAFSPHVVPKPHDWKDSQIICGYWFLDQLPMWSPPPELTAFLEAGPPPVYIGFGSTHAGDANQAAKMIVDALRRAGKRGIVVRGWVPLHADEVTDTVFFADEVPFDWLFPRMAAVVHHGGAGTTGIGLRAGVPNIVVPQIVDQPYWGARIAELGVGPRPITRRKLTAKSLATAITQAVSDAAMQQRARDLGAKIRAEDGVAVAVLAIEERFSALFPAVGEQRQRFIESDRVGVVPWR